MTDTTAGLLQIGLLVLLLAACHVPLGDFMARTFTSTRHLRIERGLYRVLRVDGDADTRWPTYALSVLGFSAVSILFLYAFLRLQQFLPLSLGMPAMEPTQAWNTAVSFVTNTNWQSYSGESAVGHLVQMAGLAVQNFLSAAVGIAVAVALVRGLVSRGAGTIGNFWVDLTRTALRILLPLSVVAAVVLLLTGVVQNFTGATTYTTLAGGSQTIIGGPIASQEAIKELGTNGGGFFNANSAHPFEGRPRSRACSRCSSCSSSRSPCPARSAAARGPPAGAGDPVGHGVGLRDQPRRDDLGRDARAGDRPAGRRVGDGGQGDAVRGVVVRPVRHRDDVDLDGGGELLPRQLHRGRRRDAAAQHDAGRGHPRGTGSGLYGMLILAIITVFVAGLMVGRTPEYLGKGIRQREITYAALYILATPVRPARRAAIALSSPDTRSAMLNSGPHGLSEVLYAFASAANNNGSAFAGLSVNTPFWNVALGLAMAIGRFLPMLLVLALAGAFAQQRPAAETAGTLPTRTPTFAGMHFAVVVVVTALTFFPALALGPIAEALTGVQS